MSLWVIIGAVVIAIFLAGFFTAALMAAAGQSDQALDEEVMDRHARKSEFDLNGKPPELHKPPYHKKRN